MCPSFAHQKGEDADFANPALPFVREHFKESTSTQAPGTNVLRNWATMLRMIMLLFRIVQPESLE